MTRTVEPPHRRATAVELSNLLVMMTEDEAEPIARTARRLRDKLAKRGMSMILDMMPGTPTERAKQLGVTRQTYYGWIRGRQRPGPAQAKKIEEITGVPAKEFCFES